MTQIRTQIFNSPSRFGPFITRCRLLHSAVLLLPMLLLAGVLLQPWAEPKWMFLDTITAAQFSSDCCHVYYGFISNLGIMIWTATAAICLFAAAFFMFLSNNKSLSRFALSAGVLTGWLALDDAFLVHENVMPSLGVPQNAVIASYAILALLYVFASWRIILRSEFWILFLGGAALAISILVDTVFHSLVPALVYIEDSAKFFGIFCWGYFHIITLFSHFALSANQINNEQG